MHDLTDAEWRKSSRSGDQGNCVEVADNLPGVVAVRDSKDPNGPALVFEPALTVAVSRAFADFTTQVLVATGPWMLTRDAGTQLRQLYRRRAAAPSWDALLPRYAELQIRVATDLEHFLRLGVPDVRPSVAVRAYLGFVERVLSADPAGAFRLRALEPAVAGLADSLADCLPSTLVLEEVH